MGTQLLYWGLRLSDGMGDIWGGTMDWLDQMGTSAIALAPLFVTLLKYMVSRRFPGLLGYLLSTLVGLVLLQVYIHPVYGQYQRLRAEYHLLQLEYDKVCLPGELYTPRFIDVCVMTAADLKMWPIFLAHTMVIGRHWEQIYGWLNSWVTTGLVTLLVMFVAKYGLRRVTRSWDERRLVRAKMSATQ